MKTIGRKFRSAAPILFILLGVVLMLYPYISEYIFENRVDSEIIAYEENVEKAENQQYENLLERAEQYNDNLQKAQIQLTDPFMEAKETDENLSYEKMLQLDDSGIMGYIELPTIGVKLPVYQGTSSKVLERGVGHLKGSSLPVGGTGTHAVLTGHTGLSQAKLLSDLSEMKAGDVFYISVLGRKMAYEVYATSVVLPEDTEQLRIEKDKDLVTLVTCTPYGINTHRLFVHGRRTTFDEQQYQEEITKKPEIQDSRWKSAYRRALIGGCLLAVLLFVVLSFGFRKMMGIGMVVTGVLVFLSPEITQEYYYVRTQTALKFYDEEQEDLRNQEEDMLYQKMSAYNQSIFEDKQTVMNDPWDYTQDLSEIGDLSEMVVGYVDVPALGQVFPIYFGATTEHMAEGVAVMNGTSMPIGGENTNCVLAGHRGYNQNKTFFKNIENLTEGDEIYITNQWGKLQYEVEKIDIVEPDNFEAVKIQKGKDMVTLLTCHPYGSHGRYRYLVFCTRVKENQIKEEKDNYKHEKMDYIVASDGRIYPSSQKDIRKEKVFRLCCAGMLLLVMVSSVFRSKRRRSWAKGDRN